MTGCCGKTSVLVKTSAFLFFLGLVLLVLGYGTPVWSFRPGENEGLWEKCIASVCTSSNGDPISDEAWYIVTQVLVTLGLVVGIVGVILTFVIMFDKDCAENKSLRIAALFKAYCAAAFLIAGVVIYCVRGAIFFTVFQLGFSWGITLTAALVFIIVGILLSIDIDRLHNLDEKPEA